MDVHRLLRTAGAACGALRRGLLVPAVDFLYPPVCLLCGGARDASGAAVCPGCWGRFTPAGADEARWQELSEAIREGSALDGFAACWLFDPHGPLKDAIHLLKYRRIRSIGVRMGEEIGRAVAADPLFASADLVVPVPLHRTRRRERGYNQCELLCEGIARVTGIRQAVGLLERSRYTSSQTGLERSVRRRNVEGAIRVAPGRAGESGGRRIILVDDVATTGATLKACALPLREAGARSVLGACAAVAR